MSKLQSLTRDTLNVIYNLNKDKPAFAEIKKFNTLKKDEKLKVLALVAEKDLIFPDEDTEETKEKPTKKKLTIATKFNMHFDPTKFADDIKKSDKNTDIGITMTKIIRENMSDFVNSFTDIEVDELIIPYIRKDDVYQLIVLYNSENVKDSICTEVGDKSVYSIERQRLDFKKLLAYHLRLPSNSLYEGLRKKYNGVREGKKVTKAKTPKPDRVATDPNDDTNYSEVKLEIDAANTEEEVEEVKPVKKVKPTKKIEKKKKPASDEEVEFEEVEEEEVEEPVKTKKKRTVKTAPDENNLLNE